MYILKNSHWVIAQSHWVLPVCNRHSYLSYLRLQGTPTTLGKADEGTLFPVTQRAPNQRIAFRFSLAANRFFPTTLHTSTTYNTFRLPCAYLWLSPPSARSARRLRLPTIRFEQNPPAGWPSSSAAVLRSGRSVRRRRRTAGWQAKQHAIEEHGYESCLRRQLAHHHRRGRAADACCSGRRQNRAGSSR